MIKIRVLELKIRVKLGLNEFVVKRIYNAFRVYLYIGHHKKIYNFI